MNAKRSKRSQTLHPNPALAQDTNQTLASDTKRPLRLKKRQLTPHVSLTNSREIASAAPQQSDAGSTEPRVTNALQHHELGGASENPPNELPPQQHGMRPRVSLRKALNDPQLLGSVLAGDSWKAWRCILIAAMGEPLTDSERELFTQLTQREHEPGQRVEEFAGIVGRRGGKSRAISVIATYVAGLCEHPALVSGERGVVLIACPDQRQATICLDYIEANFRNSPILRQLIETRTARTLRLSNGIDVEVRASDFRTLRGPSFVLVILDEVAFLMFDEGSSNPDTEIINAIRPGLSTTGGALFMISSPYARRGELWRTYQRHFGPNGDPLVLVAQGASRTFNPTLPQRVVDRAYERDAAWASAEYGAQFRTDIESFVSLEAVIACVAKGCFERPPQHDLSYHGFADPSGGSQDSFTLCIGHMDFARQCVVVDCLREIKPPFSPEAAVEEFSRVLKSYNIGSIIGDRYAGIWPVEQFLRFGVSYEQSAAPKSDLYRDLLPLINSGRIDLLDNAKLLSQLTSLERRVARGGRDSIDHPPGAHDDLCNAVAGLAQINSRYGSHDPTFSWVDGPETEMTPAAARARAREERAQWDVQQMLGHIRRCGIPVW